MQFIATDYSKSRGITEATLSLVPNVQFKSYTAYGKTHLECHIPGYTRYQRRVIAPAEDKTPFVWDGKGKDTGAELPILGLKEALESGAEEIYITNGVFGYLSFFQITGQLNCISMLGGEGNNHKPIIKALAGANFHGTLVWLCDYDEKLNKNGEVVWSSHTYAAKFRDALITSGFVGSFFALDYPNPTCKGYDLNDALIANPSLTLDDIQSFPMADLPIEEKRDTPKTILSGDISGSDTAAKIINGFPIDAYIERDTGQYAKNGGNIFCPFCEDSGTSKSPSFHIYPDTNSFHCFACLASGNVISYAAKKNGISNKEAFEQLARELGVWVERGEYTKTKERIIQQAPAAAEAPAMSIWQQYHNATQEFNCRITRCADKYITYERIAELGKYVALIAQTGRGKTTCPILAAKNGQRVFIVTHLVRIVDSVCSAAKEEGVDFLHYNGAKKDALLNSDHIAITINSLHRLNDRTVGANLLILDEINCIREVLTDANSHIDAIGKADVIRSIKMAIALADKVVFQSAHFDVVDYDFIKRVLLDESAELEILSYTAEPKSGVITIDNTKRTSMKSRTQAIANLTKGIQENKVPQLVVCTTQADCVVIYHTLRAIGIACELPIVGAIKPPKAEGNVAKSDRMIKKVFIPNDDVLDLDALGFDAKTQEKVSLPVHIVKCLNDGKCVVISPVGAIGLSLNGVTTDCAVSVLATVNPKSVVSSPAQTTNDLRFVIQAAARIRKPGVPVFVYGLPFNKPRACVDFAEILANVQNTAKYLELKSGTKLATDDLMEEYSIATAYSEWNANCQRSDVIESLVEMFKYDGYSSFVIHQVANIKTSENGGVEYIDTGVSTVSAGDSIITLYNDKPEDSKVLCSDVSLIKAISNAKTEISERRSRFGDDAYCPRSLEECFDLLRDRKVGQAEKLAALAGYFKGQKNDFDSVDSETSKKQIEAYRRVLVTSFIPDGACTLLAEEATSATNSYTTSIVLRNVFMPYICKVLGIDGVSREDGTYELIRLSDSSELDMAHFAGFDQQTYRLLTKKHEDTGHADNLRLLNTLWNIEISSSVIAVKKGSAKPGYLTVSLVRAILGLFCIEMVSKQKRVKGTKERTSFYTLSFDQFLPILDIARTEYDEKWAESVEELIAGEITP